MGYPAFFREGDERGTRRQGPFPPRRDDLDVGLQRIIGKLEAHLIVALAGCAMRHGVRAHFAGNLDLLLRDQRPRDRGTKEIEPLIPRIGAKHRENVVPDEFLAQILDENMRRLDAEQNRLLACRFQFLALAEIGRKGYDLAAISDLQPFEDDRRVEAARIGEHDPFHVHYGSRHGELAEDERCAGL